MGLAEQVTTGPGGTLSVMTFSATFPATPQGVQNARHHIRLAAAPSPRLDDVELVAAELALQAACHAGDSATITLTYRRLPGHTLRIEATPSHPHWTADPETITAYSYSLLLIDGMAGSFGSHSTSGNSSTAWAELPLSY